MKKIAAFVSLVACFVFVFPAAVLAGTGTDIRYAPDERLLVLAEAYLESSQGKDSVVARALSRSIERASLPEVNKIFSFALEEQRRLINLMKEWRLLPVDPLAVILMGSMEAVLGTPQGGFFVFFLEEKTGRVHFLLEALAERYRALELE